MRPVRFSTFAERQLHKDLAIRRTTLTMTEIIARRLIVSNGWRTLAIHIRPDGSVDNEAVNVRKSEDERVAWYSANGDFKIQFQTSPFEHQIFHVPAGGSVQSGPVRGELGTYPYTVTSTSQEYASADPVIIVKP
jgi:hypothetical protein